MEESTENTNKEFMQKVGWFLIVIGCIILIFFITTIGSPNIPTSSNLCVYEIPNHLKFNCSDRVVNAFQPTILEYNNALSQNCTYMGVGESYNTSSYYINECDIDVPFESSIFN